MGNDINSSPFISRGTLDSILHIDQTVKLHTVLLIYYDAFGTQLDFSKIFSLRIQNMHLKSHPASDSNYVNYEVCTITSTSGVCLPLRCVSSTDKKYF